MAIEAVTQAFSQYAQNVTSGSGSSTSSAGSSAEQEASETLSTTKTEAAHGDHQAKLKLAKIQQQQADFAPAPEAGKGAAVDKAA